MDCMAQFDFGDMSMERGAIKKSFMPFLRRNVGNLFLCASCSELDGLAVTR